MYRSTHPGSPRQFAVRIELPQGRWSVQRSNQAHTRFTQPLVRVDSSDAAAGEKSYVDLYLGVARGEKHRQGSLPGPRT
jgi:hypothetical protein